MNLATERARVLSCLKFRATDSRAPCAVNQGWQEITPTMYAYDGTVTRGEPYVLYVPPRESSHFFTMDPLDGQTFPQAGRYRHWCFYGCGWEKITELNGREVWMA